jgi:hypothetical protein
MTRPQKKGLLLTRAVAIISRMEGQSQSRSDRTNGTHRTNGTYDSPGLIPAHGGYRTLKSYQAAEIIYDATVAFCDRFIDRRSRTHDQMVQAARSGKQNRLCHNRHFGPFWSIGPLILT